MMLLQSHTMAFKTFSSSFQAIENVFAIGNKIPMGSCFCQPAGGMLNHTVEQMEAFSTYEKAECQVSLCGHCNYSNF